MDKPHTPQLQYPIQFAIQPASSLLRIMTKLTVTVFTVSELRLSCRDWDTHRSCTVGSNRFIFNTNSTVLDTVFVYRSSWNNGPELLFLSACLSGTTSNSIVYFSLWFFWLSLQCLVAILRQQLGVSGKGGKVCFPSSDSLLPVKKSLPSPFVSRLSSMIQCWCSISRIVLEAGAIVRSEVL